MGDGIFDVSLLTIEDGIQALQSEFCRKCCPLSNKNQKAVIAEEESIKNFQELIAATKVQIQTLTDTIEKKVVFCGRFC